MKTFRKSIFIILIILLSFSLFACADGYDSGPISGGGGYSGIGGGSVMYDPESKTSGMTEAGRTDSEIAKETTGESSEEPASEPEEQNAPEAGLITAAAWDDNKYYDAWKDLFVKGQEEEKDGKFVSFTGNNSWGLNSTKRVKVTVKNDENAVVGASVVYYDAEQKEYAAKTDSRGIAYIFPTAETGEVTVTVGETEQKIAFTDENRDLEADIAVTDDKAKLIKLMFVVDVTGSMGDELDYLKTELANVINRVSTDNQGVRIDLAFLFYRDDSDDQKFSYADFTNVSEQQGLTAQQQKLANQFADGGGDYPEAVDEALELAIGKNWGDENSTKLIFHILDAPPHEKSVNKTRFEGAVKAASKKGIRLCPILCSGADTLCEYVVRQEAIYTGGTFIFVTDHSGIGGEHHDPDLPNAVVEKLNDMLVRLINGYYTGTFAAPVWWNGQQQQEPEQPTEPEQPVAQSTEPETPTEDAGGQID